MFLTNQPFSPDPNAVPAPLPTPPALEGLTLPSSLQSYLQNNPVLDVVAWDFDGDGDKDLLLCGGVRLFLLRNGPGTAAAPMDQPWGVFSDASNLLATSLTQWGGPGGTFLRDFIVEAAAVADLDGDGREDLALVSSQTTQVVFTVTSPAGVLTLNVPTLNGGALFAGTGGWLRGGSTVRELVVADVKDPQGGPPDGIPDLVAARTDSFQVSGGTTTYFPGRALVAVNLGTGIAFIDRSPPGLPLSSPTPLNCNAMSLSVVDLDGMDGPDLFLGVTRTLAGAGTFVTGQNRLYLNRPTGWFEAAGAFPNTQVASVLASRPINFNGDAITDFAIITGTDTRVLVGNAAGTSWSSGTQMHVPANSRALEHDLAVTDFDNDGVLDLLDPSGAFWAGNASGLAQNNVVVTNQIVTALSHPGVVFGMVGAIADYDLDGDMDWAGVSISPAGQVQFEIWANVTRQVDFDDPLSQNTLNISTLTLPLATRFWCYDRSATSATFVLPFLAADLGPAPIRIPVSPFEGLLGLNLGQAVTIGGVIGFTLPNPLPGLLLRDYVPLTFPAGLPIGGALYYQALNIRVDTGGVLIGGAFTNVLQVTITP